MNATQRILEADHRLTIKPYGITGTHWFHVTGIPGFGFPCGLEMEVGEFLYGLVCMHQPNIIIETGTRLGISTRYMALALSDANNVSAEIHTIERDARCLDIAVAAITDLSTPNGKHYFYRDDSRELLPSLLDSCEIVDMLFLDSEPEYRYEELTICWPYLRKGGIAVIHDLANFRAGGPFGTIPQWLESDLANGSASAMQWPTSTGLTVIQKKKGVTNCTAERPLASDRSVPSGMAHGTVSELRIPPPGL